jgi:ADP-ribose pyrophosphatase YjhB (NUDIX family)
MTDNGHPLTPEEFDAIYARVPRLTVEVILRDEQGRVYLTKRAIEPCVGQWHLPGGTVRFGEPLTEAVKRVARREVGVTVQDMVQKQYIEYPGHYLHGLDSPVGIVFEVISFEGTPTVNDEAAAGGWYEKLPQPMHADVDKFLVKHKYIAG